MHEVLSIKQEKVLFKTWNLGKDTAVTPGNTSSDIFKLIQEYVNVKYNEVLNQDAAKDIVNNLNEKGYGVSIDEIIDNTDNNQYSYRGDTRSDREILADALMGATKNTAERNELEDMYIIIRSLRMGKGNYRFIVGFNSALIALGLGGLISPSTSALVHNGSTILTGVKSTTSLLD